MMMRPSGLLALLFCTMLIVGCAAPPAVQPSPTQAMPIVTAEGTQAPVATEMPQPADIATPSALDASPPSVRLKRTASTLYVSTENGVCFLYPAGFEIQPDVMRPDRQ